MLALRLHTPARTGAVEGCNSSHDPSKPAAMAELGLCSPDTNLHQLLLQQTWWCEELFAVIFSWLPPSDGWCLRQMIISHTLLQKYSIKCHVE